MRLEWYISLRYLLSPKREGSISIITMLAVTGVVMGVAALVVAMSVMNGYQVNMVRAMAGALPHVSVMPESLTGFDDPEALAEHLQKLVQPTAVAPFLLQEALVSHNDGGEMRMRGVILRGVDPATESEVDDFLAFLTDRTPAWESAQPAERSRLARKLLLSLAQPVAPGVHPVLLGPALATKLGVGIGDRLVPLAFPREGEGFSPIAAKHRMEVVGYFQTGILSFDELAIVIDLDAVEAIYPGEGKPRSLGMRLSEPLSAGKVAGRLRAKKTIGGEQFSVYSWLESNQSLFQVVRVQKVMLFIVLMLIVVIAFFGIIGAMVMLVSEKGREIAILKSLGARGSTVRTVFFIQGALIGVVGTVLGVALGLGLCWVLDTFSLVEIPVGVYPGSDRIPVLVSFQDLLLVVVGTMTVALVATFYPASKAMKLSPVQGLRHT